MTEALCDICGQSFMKKRPHQLRCSQPCMNAAAKVNKARWAHTKNGPDPTRQRGALLQCTRSVPDTRGGSNMTIAAAPLEPDALPVVLLAGRAVFTLRNRQTGRRLTYKISVCRDNAALFFVQVLTGANNEADYQYLGTIRGQTYAHGAKSQITEDAQSARVFAWFWCHRHCLPAGVDVYHEGHCLRCGRILTVPESISTGIGPECSKKLGPLALPPPAGQEAA